jgi:hypothetical protein
MAHSLAQNAATMKAIITSSRLIRSQCRRTTLAAEFGTIWLVQAEQPLKITADNPDFQEGYPLRATCGVLHGTCTQRLNRAAPACAAIEERAMSLSDACFRVVVHTPPAATEKKLCGYRARPLMSIAGCGGWK